MKPTIHFDRVYWPKEAAKPVVSIDITMGSFFESHYKEAQVFVAEALIDEPPLIWVDRDIIVVSLWEVGGDTLEARVSIQEAIEDSVRVYDVILSDKQLTDVEERLKALDCIEQSVARAKTHLLHKVADYREKT